MKRVEEVESLLEESGSLDLQLLPVDLPLPLFHRIAEEHLLRHNVHHAQELCHAVLTHQPSLPLKQVRRVGNNISKLHKGKQPVPIRKVMELPMSVGELGEWLVGGRVFVENLNFLISDCMSTA